MSAGEANIWQPRTVVEVNAIKAKTLSIAASDPVALPGDFVRLSDRGYCLFKYENGFVADGFGTIAHSTIVDLFLVAQIEKGLTYPEAYGADVANDDNFGALQAAYNSIPFTGMVVYNALYKTKSPIAITNKLIHSAGQSSGGTGVIGINCNAFEVDISGLSDKDQIVFTFVGLQSDQNGLHTGIKFIGQGTSALKQQLVVLQCAFTGINNQTTWKLGVSLQDGNFSTVFDCFFRGNTSDRSKMTSAIQCVDSTDCKFNSNHIYWADVAVSISGFSEGNTIRDCHMVPVNIGVRHQGTGNLVWVIDNHISAYIGGVTLGTTGVNAVNHCHVRGNFIFKNALSTDNFVGITINSEKAEVTGNEILIPGGSAAGGSQNGIVLGADATRCRVGANEIANMDTGIIVTTLALKNNIIGNTFLGNTADIIDNGTETIKTANQAGNTVRGAVIKLNADQSIPDSAVTIINWGSAEIDTNSAFSGGPSSKLTVPAGIVQARIRANIKWATDSTGERLVEVLKNGAATAIGLGSDRRLAIGQSDSSLTSSILNVVAGDFFEIRVFQTSGGALDVVTEGNTWFEIELI